MLPVDIEEVQGTHIAALVSERVAERKVLEYKERLPDNTDSAKKEVLADVCSFANSSGGDIVFGIRDERDANGRATGVPEAIVGTSHVNPSAERERIEAIIRDGVKPRIPNIQTRHIEIQGQGSVVILRIGRSWLGPHMVTYGGTSRFYSRHGTGKYQLDVQEIGLAFAGQRSLGEELRNWRADRIARALSDESPMRLVGPSKLLLHFVPASALAGPQTTGLWPVPNQIRNLLKPSSLSSSTAWRYNSDGFLIYSLREANGFASYVQLFRNGCIEYGDGYILNVGHERGRPGDIPSKSFEDKLIATFSNALLTLNRLAIQDPIYFSCTMIGVEGSSLSQDGLAFYHDEIQHKFDRNVIQTPEIQVDRAEQAPYLNTVLPIVDSIWQANGYEGTLWPERWGVGVERR